MITHLSHHTIFVTDQKVAREFYIDKLGFKVKIDFDMGGWTFLTVSPPMQDDMELILMQLSPSPMMDEATCEQLKTLLAAGSLPTGVFKVDDCRATYEELKAKGVEFTREPTDQFYGVEALIKDPFGNWYSMTEPKEMGEGKGD